VTPTLQRVIGVAQEVRGALHRAPRLLPRRCGVVI